MRINIRPNVGGALTGLKATSMVKAIVLNWTLPTDLSSYAATQIWWGTSAVLGAATLLDTVNGNSYVVSLNDTNERYFWIRKVNQYGRTDDPYTGPVSAAGSVTSGTPGNNGSDGRSYVTAYAASATTSTNTAPGNTNGIDSVPAANSGGIAGTWSKTVPALSTGQFLYQVDGSYNPTTGVVTWSIPYWSSLRVGSLSAISATIGTLRTATTGGRVEISDNLIKVYDTANALRVKIGNLN